MPRSVLAPPRPGPAGPRGRAIVSPAQRPVPRLRNPAVLLAVILTAQMMVVLDATIVNVALPHIQRSLGFSTSALSWVLNAYILTFGGFLLLGARAGDLFGRRRVFLLGIAVFSLSSLVGGLAVSGWALLAARAVQGMGAALAAPCALSLLTTAFPEGQQRVRAIGLYTTVSAAGGATGLVAGGFLTQLVSWRWVMFVNVPIGVVVWLVGRSVLVESERQHGHFDLIGALTCTVGVTGMVLGLVEAGSLGWSNPVTLVGLVGGLFVFGFFLHHESRVEEPILPLSLLSHVTRNSANASRALLYAGFYGLFYFLAQFLQDVQGYSPLRAGLAFVPMPASVFLASQLTSRVLLRRVQEKVVMVVGTAIAIAGLVLATRVGAGSTYAQIVVSLVLIGAGSGMTLVALTSASLADVPPDIAGAASGLVNVSQQLGAAVGLAVLVTVFNSLAGHAQLVPGSTTPSSVHSLDGVFAVAGLFAVGALMIVIFGVRRTGPAVAGTEGGDPGELAERDDEFVVRLPDPARDVAALGDGCEEGRVGAVAGA
jgi:EmrB/QacA subfamily drug resistance transporter